MVVGIILCLDYKSHTSLIFLQQWLMLWWMEVENLWRQVQEQLWIYGEFHQRKVPRLLKDSLRPIASFPTFFNLILYCGPLMHVNWACLGSFGCIPERFFPAPVCCGQGRFYVEHKEVPAHLLWDLRRRSHFQRLCPLPSNPWRSNMFQYPS